MNHLDHLITAGVPEHYHADALRSLDEARERSEGLLWHKLKVRLFKAGKIAKMIPWEADRLVEVDAFMADCDIAPMLNITAHGDNGPWHDTPEGGRPVAGYWLNPDPESEEYQFAVSKNYWCKGQHPRSQKSRKAWYRRNGGEYRAWRLGAPVNPADGIQRWTGTDGKLSVEVCRSGSAWIVKTKRRLIGSLGYETRHGFEVDNVFSGQYSPQMWFPIPGYELRAPVSWSVRPSN